MHQAFDPPPCCQLTLVCNSPVSFDSLVRILVPLDTAAEATGEGECDPLQQQYTRALLTCEQLHSLDAEAVPFAAFPCSQTHLQVISHKVLAKQVCSETLRVQECQAGCMHLLAKPV
jgi:phage-related protein